LIVVEFDWLLSQGSNTPVLIVMILVLGAVFIVLLSWQCHCRRSPGGVTQL